MKIVRSNELKTYNPAGHYQMLAQRAYGKNETGNEVLTIGYSQFLPGGGAENSVVKPGMELVYYIIHGEMTLTTPEGTTVLKAGDSVGFKAGEERSVKNESNEPAGMLVIAGVKVAE